MRLDANSPTHASTHANDAEQIGRRPDISVILVICASQKFQLEWEI